MKEVVLLSGKKLGIHIADLRSAKALFNVVASELKNNKFDPKQEMDINFVKDIIIGIAVSEKLEDHLWPILNKCVYGADKDRVTPELFDNIEAREDYLEIMYHVTLENVRPFLKNLYGKYEHIFREMGLALV